jgi:hypothetical protein
MMTTTTPNHCSSMGAPTKATWRRLDHLAARLRRRRSWYAWARYLHFDAMEDDLVRDDPEALDLLDQATENPEGRPAGSHATMASETTVNNVNSYETRESPVGNTSQYAIRRLRKERPDLADERRE